MASASALQYPRPAGTLSYSSSERFPPYDFPSSSIYTDHAASLPLSSSSYLPPAGRVSSFPLNANSGAVAARRSMSGHAKVHKRASIGHAQGNPRNSESSSRRLSQSSSVVSPESTAASSKALAKERLKSNLRKLTQPKNEDKELTLDLSQTVEENEKRSGLAICSPDSPSIVQSPFSPVTAELGTHSRNVSNNSQYSSASAAFKPSEPFSIAIREDPRPRTPSLATSHSPSVLSSAEFFSEGLSTMPYEPVFDSPKEEEVSIPEIQKPLPPLRANTVGSNTSSLPGLGRTVSTPSTSQPQNLAPSSSVTSTSRPRRSTNQSSDTVPTSRSQSSLDRAFTYVARRTSVTGKENNPSDLHAETATRLASINAARQAFQEKEEAKDRKHERREQRAAEKARRTSESKGLGRTITEFGGGSSLRRHRASSARSSASKTAARSPQAADAASTREHGAATLVETAAPRYADIPAGPAPEKGTAVPTSLPVRANRTKRAGKASTAKRRYLRFLSWLRTKLLRLSNGSRHR